MFANIIVDISHENLDKPFTYNIPTELKDSVGIGNMVIVPFGKSDRLIKGYVIDIINEYNAEYKVKDIKEVVRDSVMIESKLISLAYFIKSHYGSTMNQALKTILSVKSKIENKKIKKIKLNISEDAAVKLKEKYAETKKFQKRKDLLEVLLSVSDGKKEDNSFLLNDIKEKIDISDSILSSMEKDGTILIESEGIYRNPVKNYEVTKEKLILTDEQRKVVEEINARGNDKPHLIYGITGSGKTLVYMEIIENVLKQGKEVIVLIPEIALTYQMIKKFYQRFGNIVSIINSSLSNGEKYDQFMRAKNGDIKIVIGPRSALFTPFTNLGLIIMDEEHDMAYKSDSVPKYHAREVAIKRCINENAIMVMGSATPSVASFYNALNGRYHLHKMLNRVGESERADVEIVDLREELRCGNKSVISFRLDELIKDRLEKKEQIMLFINRRGYSNFVSCRKCGKSIKCPHCDVTLTYHKNNKLECHYCGYTRDYPKVCDSCGSKYIGKFGIGTEKVEEYLKEKYKGVRVLRMDHDTTRKKGDYERILSEFSKGNADVLVGTQMIVKGHDYENVTLVGALLADLSMFESDYLSEEKTFELLTQAAGRAGRGRKKGNVVIQTYNPENECILYAKEQDYEKFYDNEISYRKILSYPPVSNMAAILVSGKNEEYTEKIVNIIYKKIYNTNVNDLIILGPVKAGIFKINNIYRFVIYLKHKDESILIRLKDAFYEYIENKDEYKQVNILFDFNPLNIY